jgi:quinol monooxygenase YgiN
MSNRLVIALLVAASLLLLGAGQRAVAQDTGPVVIVVELEIVPTELDNFKAAVKENGAAWIREEAGCLEFNVAFAKDNPTHAFVFEVYESADAVAAHQATPRFKSTWPRPPTGSSRASSPRWSRSLLSPRDIDPRHAAARLGSVLAQRSRPLLALSGGG